MTNSLETATDADFDAKVRRRPGITLVEFGGASCAPCIVLEKILIEIGSELPALPIIVMDAEACPDTAAACDVRGVPTLLFFKDGRIEARLIGMQRKDKIVAAARKIGA